MARTYKPSPFGDAEYPWVNNPDTKFNADGVFKLDLRVTGPAAVKFKGEVDEQVDRAFAAHMDALEEKGVKPAERKKWEKQYPYTEEEDDDGNPTGAIVFHFRQNAKIKLKDGSTKDVAISLRDSRDKPMKANIFSGSVVRAMFAYRDIVVTSAKKAGVRLDFSMVQVKKLAEGGAGGGSFGAVEDGYVETDEEAQQGSFGSSDEAVDGDY